MVLLYGTRSPEDLLFTDELKRWESLGVEVLVTVDYGTTSWTGRVGLVTTLIARAGFDPRSTLALICGPEVMMRFTAAALIERGVRPTRSGSPSSATCAAGSACAGTASTASCSSASTARCCPTPRSPACSDSGRCDMPEHTRHPPKLAVWKFASCDGCQLTLLNCEDELIPLAGEVEIAYFPEATRAVVEGPYDVSLVEGSVTTPADAERILEVRRVSRRLITIGACATSGGIQALRNFADVAEYRSIVYAHPEYVETLERSTPIAAHVTVDFELHGCPIDSRQLLEVLAAFVQDRRPRIPSYSVCVECKRRGAVCVAVAHGTPCLGPGHPGRLRRPLPGLLARLLRLLRPAGHPEHRLPGGPAAGARHGRVPGAAHLPHLQRRRRAVQARERATRPRTTKEVAP